MLICPQCSGDVADTSRFCSDCGSPVDVSSAATSTGLGRTPVPARPPSSHASAARLASGPAASQARFVPGAVLAGRYRIVGLLGRGGMGEVYRADDLRLGQPVALKFLPEALQHDADRLERFLNGVRMARQVSHPAVCRVHDIGESEGQQFLSMEFVDGEDLASLQRRIGRLPPDKALQIARQLCAGLAAAHEKGVLHRDLKPENVMLDGRGMARITDFDLAEAAEAINREDVRSGTPAYMSPEQLAGREVTARSDIYALGLVLYELFTGRRPFSGRTFAELLRARQQPPPPPSAVVETVDPAVEQAILRCLEPDPGRRPGSALALAAALPGGDALGAALAAGQTPSPELVAAAGGGEALSVTAGWACMALVVAGLVGVPLLSRSRQLFRMVPAEKAPAALDDRARDLLRSLGHTEPAADSAVGFSVDTDYLQYVQARDRSAGRWERLREGQPPVLRFWYRQSPRALVSTRPWGRVSITNPPVVMSGMAGTWLDLRGRLVQFYSVPPQVESDPARPPSPPDWSALFTAAGLDQARFTPAPSRWTPPFFSDTRAAWEGAYPDRPDIAIRVEAAGHQGRPVHFQIVAPWTRPERMQPFRPTPGREAGNRVAIGLVTLLVTAAALLARRHVLQGRGDRRGAFRLARYAFGAAVVAWAIQAHHVADQGEFGIVIQGIAFNLFIAALIWTLYLALEPYVRRRHPRMLVGWTRLLSGHLGDSLVGRDFLIGTAAGTLLAVVLRLLVLLPPRFGLPAAEPIWQETDALLGMRYAMSLALSTQLEAAAAAMAFLLLFLLIRLVVRRDWLAVVLVGAILTVQPALSSEWALWIILPLQIVAFLVVTLVLLRFGFLATIVVLYVNELFSLPLTSELGGWAAGPTFLVAFVTLGLATWGFRTALGSRPAFGGPLPE